MRLSLALPVGARDVTHAARRVNTHAHLAARAATSPLGALTLAGRPACGGRPFKGRGRFPPIIGRQRRVGPHDPDQRLIVLRATGIGFKPPHQRQGVFRTEIDLVKVLEKFEASKHDRFYLNGDQASGVGMRVCFNGTGQRSQARLSEGQRQAARPDATPAPATMALL
jgi:hypothetical protein